MKGDYGTKLWSTVKGMRSKWFWFDEETARCGGVYTFFNWDAVEAYKKSDTFKGMW